MVWILVPAVLVSILSDRPEYSLIFAALLGCLVALAEAVGEREKMAAVQADAFEQAERTVQAIEGAADPPLLPGLRAHLNNLAASDRAQLQRPMIHEPKTSRLDELCADLNVDIHEVIAEAERLAKEG